MLTIIDEFSRRCLAIVVARRLNSDDVLAALTELFVEHGPPTFIRSDNCSPSSQVGQNGAIEEERVLGSS